MYFYLLGTDDELDVQTSHIIEMPYISNAAHEDVPGKFLFFFLMKCNLQEKKKLYKVSHSLKHVLYQMACYISFYKCNYLFIMAAEIIIFDSFLLYFWMYIFFI